VFTVRPRDPPERDRSRTAAAETVHCGSVPDHPNAGRSAAVPVHRRRAGSPPSRSTAAACSAEAAATTTTTTTTTTTLHSLLLRAVAFTAPATRCTLHAARRRCPRACCAARTASHVGGRTTGPQVCAVFAFVGGPGLRGRAGYLSIYLSIYLAILRPDLPGRNGCWTVDGRLALLDCGRARAPPVPSAATLAVGLGASLRARHPSDDVGGT
jgi:hypothetical protein